jgi:hypothetical protein
MLRKRATRRAAGKQKNAQGTNRRRAAATANTLPVARDQAAVPGTAEERLNSVAKEAFRNMGED